MKFYYFATLLSVLVCHTHALRGGGEGEGGSKQQQGFQFSSSWHLQEDTKCDLWMLVVDHGNNESEEIWECHKPGEGKLGLGFGLGLDGGTGTGTPPHKELQGTQIKDWLQLHGAESGKTSITIRAGTEIINDKTIKVEPKDVLDIENRIEDDRFPGQQRRQRRNLATSGLHTLVVRVTAGDGNAPASADELYTDIFNDTHCLKSRYAACSYNQLQIEPYNGDQTSTVSGLGVVDVTISMNATGATRNALQSQAEDQAAALFNKPSFSNLEDIFDLVMVCLPPGSDGGWIAYAYINGFSSYYNAIWCQKLSTQMHEVGHNLGLHHSGELTGTDSAKTYGDQQGMMGYSYNSDDYPIMCFNPAKNWQLGWYESKRISINPEMDLPGPVVIGAKTEFILNGIDDYDYVDINNNDDKYVVMKINHISSYDYYIGYNKKSGINSETQESANQVTITLKLGTETSSQPSKRVASLNTGSSELIPDFTDNGMDLEVKYVRLENNRDAIIEMSLVCDRVVFEIEITTDTYPQETSFKVTDNYDDAVIWEKPPGYYTQANINHTDYYCLSNDTGTSFTFHIFDDYGDGISGIGNTYTGRVDGRIIFEGADFTGSSESIVFSSTDTSSPTGTPTESPTELPSDSPTTASPTTSPTASPTAERTESPTSSPSDSSSNVPSSIPSLLPSLEPSSSAIPTGKPSGNPSTYPSAVPSTSPSVSPSSSPSNSPTDSAILPLCEDNSGKFSITNKKNGGRFSDKDCNWIKKRAERCDYNLETSGTGKDECPVTCGVVC